MVLINSAQYRLDLVIKSQHLAPWVNIISMASADHFHRAQGNKYQQQIMLRSPIVSLKPKPQPLPCPNSRPSTRKPKKVMPIGHRENYNICHIKQCLRGKDGYKVTDETAVSPINASTNRRIVNSFRVDTSPDCGQSTRLGLRQMSQSTTVLDRKVQGFHQLNTETVHYEKQMSTQRSRPRSNSQLQTKSKPIGAYPGEREHIQLENEILRCENEKLKRLSQQRKKQICVLNEEVWRLQARISSITLP